MEGSINFVTVAIAEFEHVQECIRVVGRMYIDSTEDDEMETTVRHLGEVVNAAETIEAFLKAAEQAVTPVDSNR